MLNKITKSETQKLIRENLRALSAAPGKMEREIITRNLTLIIDSAFRGDEGATSTAFDTSTELLQELKPFFNKSIGDARRHAAAEIIADYFTPEGVTANGKTYKMKCYISFESYSQRVCFYYTVDGFTHGNFNNICDIYFRDGDDAEPLNFEKLRACYRYSGEYITPGRVNSHAAAIRKKNAAAVAKVEKLIKAANEIIAAADAQTPSDSRVFKSSIYDTSIIDVWKAREYGAEV